MSPANLAKLDQRAAQAGRKRSEYVRGLIEEDLARSPKQKHVFASADLVGAFAIKGLPRADNKAVRRIIRERLLARYGKR